MSGGIAYVWDTDGKFSTKCNPEMVELCRVEDKDDCDLIKSLLIEFKELTGSLIAEQLLNEFDVRMKEFVKVFPYEYQRVLKQQAIEQQQATVVSNSTQSLQQNNHEAKLQDIEDSVTDVTLEQKKAERALDKIRGTIPFDTIHNCVYL